MNIWTEPRDLPQPPNPPIPNPALWFGVWLWQSGPTWFHTGFKSISAGKATVLSWWVYGLSGQWEAKFQEHSNVFFYHITNKLMFPFRPHRKHLHRKRVCVCVCVKEVKTGLTLCRGTVALIQKKKWERKIMGKGEKDRERWRRRKGGRKQRHSQSCTVPNPFWVKSVTGKVTSITVIVPTSIFEQSLIIVSRLMWAIMAHARPKLWLWLVWTPR